MSIISKEVIISQLESAEEFPILLSEVWEWLGYYDKQTAKRSFLGLGFVENVDFRIIAHATTTGISANSEQDLLMSVDCFKLWAMSAQTKRGKEVRLYYLQVEKEWKADRQFSQPQINSEHVAAYQFQQFEYIPWSEKHPIAASIFLDWQGIQQRAINGAREVQVIAPQPVEFALPSEAMQEALNGAFLNLNRSGLAMNKLFHFLDRIPTMKSMGSEAIDELAEALTEAGRTIEDLQEERNTWKTAALSGASKLAALQKEIGTWKKQCKESQGQADSVRRAADNFSNEVKDLKQQIKNLKTRTTSPTANAIVVSEGRKRKALPPMRSADPT